VFQRPETELSALPVHHRQPAWLVGTGQEVCFASVLEVCCSTAIADPEWILSRTEVPSLAHATLWCLHAQPLRQGCPENVNL
jgi:hypothetical protein